MIDIENAALLALGLFAVSAWEAGGQLGSQPGPAGEVGTC
jgi:hypothetical protein